MLRPPLCPPTPLTPRPPCPPWQAQFPGMGPEDLSRCARGVVLLGARPDERWLAELLDRVSVLAVGQLGSWAVGQLGSWAAGRTSAGWRSRRAAGLGNQLESASQVGGWLTPSRQTPTPHSLHTHTHPACSQWNVLTPCELLRPAASSLRSPAWTTDPRTCGEGEGVTLRGGSYQQGLL